MDVLPRLGYVSQCIFILLLSLRDTIQLQGQEPTFDSPMANITVKESATAVLPCSVKHLSDRQVVWTDQWSTLLTHEERRIIDDDRISVERPFVKDWNLHIRDVKYRDQGMYNCQINTQPVKIKVVHLKVQVPAKILDNESTVSRVAREGESVTLFCNSTGIPMPTVTWYRYVPKDQLGEIKKSEFCAGTNKVGVSGEVLIIHNMSRHCGGMYECNAFNGVPPAMTKMIKVSVQFSPEVSLPNSRIGQVLTKETMLECEVTASPQAVATWRKIGVDEPIKNNKKYRIEIYDEEDDFTMSLALRIMDVEEDDFGQYICEATNILGTAKSTMTLYDYALSRRRETTTPVITTTTTDMLRAPFMSTRVNRVSSGQQQKYKYDVSNTSSRSKVVKDGRLRYETDVPEQRYDRWNQKTAESRGKVDGSGSATLTASTLTLATAMTSAFLVSVFPNYAIGSLRSSTSMTS